MEPISVGIIVFAVLIILILARMPVGAAMMLTGAVGFAGIVGLESTWGMLQTVPYATFASQGMSRWVMWFMLFGLCLAGGMAYGLFAALRKWLGNGATGSLLAALFTSGLLGSFAAFGSIGLKPLTRMLWPRLRQCGCSAETSVGVLAGGFSLGILFPLPSTLLIIYGVITEQSIGKVFWCSLPPTIISIVLYVAAVVIKNRLTAPENVVPQTSVRVKTATPKPGPGRSAPEPELSAFKSSWDIILIFVVIIWGSLSGVLVPTESAALAVLLAVIFTAVRRRLNKQTYMTACRIALVGTGWLFMLLLGAMIFSYFLTLTRLPYELSEALAYGGLSRYAVLALVLLVIVLLGCCIEAMPLMLLVVPLMYPMVYKMGFHPIWFGIVALRCAGLGLMLPFGGINLRRVQKLTGVDAVTAAKGVLPFVAADIILIILLMLIPERIFGGLLT